VKAVLWGPNNVDRCLCQTVLPVHMMICLDQSSPPLSDGAADAASVPCLAPCLTPHTR
jgi:hypothetical protein